MSAKDRRAVLIGVLVLAPALAYIWGVRPYFAALGEARDELITERSALAREQAAVITTQRNPAFTHAADSAMRSMQPRLFEGKDDVMASAELAAYVGDMARGSRVWLEDAGTRPAVSTPSGVRMLRVEVRAESDLRGILTFLTALEHGGRLVRVDRLDISRASRAKDEDTETLAMTATISGFAISSDSATGHAVVLGGRPLAALQAATGAAQ